MENVVPTDPRRIKSEAFAALDTMPFTQLLDLVSNAAIWPRDMRLQAARVAVSSKGIADYARTIAVKTANDPDFAAIMEEISCTDNEKE